MKKAIALICVLTMLLMVGCQKASDEMAERSIEADTGSDVEIDSSKGSMSVESEDGRVDVTTNMQDSDEWCPEGGEWTMTSAGVEGDASAEWRVDKLETSGKYAGLCHVIYTAQGPDGEMRMDYYFDESGENGYVEMEMNGQKIVQEFHN